MRKLNSVIEFGKLVTELDQLSKDQKGRGCKEIGMAKACNIAKVACEVYKVDGRKGVMDTPRWSHKIKRFDKRGNVWITGDQAERGIAIVQALINKTRWGIFSKMTGNMRRICR